MAKAHEQIVDMVMLQWSNANRGRLLKNHNGVAYRGAKTNDYFQDRKRFIILTAAIMIKYGLGKGSSDLFGWEYVDIYCPDASITVPIVCAVEVKTKAYPDLTDEQVLFLNNIININGRAYVARENNNGYDLIKWELVPVK